MVVAMACNEQWYKYLVVNIYSLLKSNPHVKKIYLLLETDNIHDVPKLEDVIAKYPVEVKAINFNEMIDNLVTIDNTNRDTIYSNFCFARLILPSVVKEDKVLYIDTDAIVLKDISRIWYIDMDEYYIAGCKDYGIIRDGTYKNLNITGKYVNSGFILLNLKKMRHDKVQDKFFDVINNRSLKYPDQDALNIVCQDKELFIPSMYNYIVNVTKPPISEKYIKVIHYSGPKIQWLVDKSFCELWYDKEEEFYNEFGD